jgi:hypothetical protein
MLNCLIVGKPTQLVTPPPPVLATNHAATNSCLKDDSEVQEEVFYLHLPAIPVANDFCNIDDGYDNEKYCLNDELDDDYPF